MLDLIRVYTEGQALLLTHFLKSVFQWFWTHFFPFFFISFLKRHAKLTMLDEGTWWILTNWQKRKHCPSNTPWIRQLGAWKLIALRSGLGFLASKIQQEPVRLQNKWENENSSINQQCWDRQSLRNALEETVSAKWNRSDEFWRHALSWPNLGKTNGQINKQTDYEQQNDHSVWEGEFHGLSECIITINDFADKEYKWIPEANMVNKHL